MRYGGIPWGSQSKFRNCAATSRTYCKLLIFQRQLSTRGAICTPNEALWPPRSCRDGPPSPKLRSPNHLVSAAPEPHWTQAFRQALEAHSPRPFAGLHPTAPRSAQRPWQKKRARRAAGLHRSARTTTGPRGRAALSHLCLGRGEGRAGPGRGGTDTGPWLNGFAAPLPPPPSGSPPGPIPPRSGETMGRRQLIAANDKL